MGNHKMYAEKRCIAVAQRKAAKLFIPDGLPSPGSIVIFYVGVGTILVSYKVLERYFKVGDVIQ
jgi:hypothetical protein